MKRLGVLALLIVWGILFKVFLSDYILIFPDAADTMAFGMILLMGYLVSDLFVPLRLPRITAYLLVGLLMGPFVFDIITKESLKGLRFIDDLALNFIGLAAGAELHLDVLKKRIKPLLWIIGPGSLFVFTGVSLTLHVLALPLFQQETAAATWVAIILVSVIALARSPSAVIAIISETRARGSFTETVMGITVSMDVIIILFFALASSIGDSIVHAGQSFDVHFLLNIIVSLAVSFLFGTFLGGFISFYFARIASETIFFILALVFTVAKLTEFSSHILLGMFGIEPHLEPMIMCMTAGFVVRNFGRSTGRFLRAIEQGSLPVYVLFFVLTGANLNIPVLRQYWHVAVLLFVLRLVYMTGGGYIGARLAGEPPRLARLYGLTFITQAGVSFGLVRMMKTTFPEWGPVLGTVLVAAVITNEIAGPILVKTALEKSGETGRRNEPAAPDRLPPVPHVTPP